MELWKNTYVEYLTIGIIAVSSYERNNTGVFSAVTEACRGNSRKYLGIISLVRPNPRDGHIFPRKVRPKMVATEEVRGGRHFWSTFQGKMWPFPSGEVETKG